MFHRRRRKSFGDRVVDVAAGLAGGAAGRLAPGVVRAGVRGASLSAARRSAIYRAAGLSAASVLGILALGFAGGYLYAKSRGN
ncbi:hypothetical protein [Rubrobacter taiwanensis]|jgi:hypothetical protein|uniref:hypothetical protein n=1 Tax=Rubrobacter taiwanensis TaxID=185139 RepID=UPI001404E3B0|nr:hypothetical protein [Rubrobacter taiwanensis]